MVLLNKKGQSEVIGLVIIVLILIVVGLIFLKFYLSNGNSLNKESISNIKANNLVNAIRSVSICNNNMADAIIACCDQKEFCGKDACQFINEEINVILEKSLEERVYFEAKQQNNLCLSINNDCQGISSTENLIRNQDGDAKIRVKICY